MAQTLTTPITPTNRTQQGITTIIIQTPHVRNAGDTAMELDRPIISLLYEVTTWDADGIPEDKPKAIEVLQPDWPSAVRLDVRDLYAKAELHAVAQGLIGAGTPEVLGS